MIKVLLIDDDVVFSQIATTILKEHGMDVHYQNALTAIAEVVKAYQPSVILLDIEIGNEDGIDIIPQIRAASSMVPIIVISSHTELSEVQRALNQGAVNYLKKPFDMEEMAAFVRRYAVPHVSFIFIGTLKLNLESRELYKGEMRLKKLTPLEFELLTRLHLNMGKVVSKETLLKHGDRDIDIHTLYNYIRKLTKLLQADKKLAIYKEGNGYVLRNL